jgi:hypothetical protein
MAARKVVDDAIRINGITVTQATQIEAPLTEIMDSLDVDVLYITDTQYCNASVLPAYTIKAER